ncbi:arylsulfatase [Sphingopyxis sp.]|uniref:arylsulfatase n=1 Tax=Sphingopyxis sp. TaxID=1908224 RepID=UPI002D76D415|nr:arylsulfatase [Sphingopyxis sp.]HET6524446.1 arylsulfatase [Sphingopyxis sp.]
MRKYRFFGIAAACLGAAAIAQTASAAAGDQPRIGKTFADSVPGPINRTTAPAGAPNILVWVIDDMGFGQLGSYGGLIETPNIDRVAQRGLRYTNYHTTPICSASRAALLTGRNSHRVHIGGHSAIAVGFPGQDALVPRSAGTVAENLRQSGYLTYAIGKWDHLPQADASAAGPFTYWPSGQGFDRYYGFLAFDADNFDPTLWTDHQPVSLSPRPDYHLSADMAEKAIGWIGARDATDPHRPFMMYWATGAVHAPHHAPRRWLDHYKGRFDAGWDAAAQQILDRQKKLGLVPADMALPPLPAGVKHWADLSRDEQRMFARQMEAFAAQLSHADEQFGRILDALETRGELDNTVVLITADNGASAEGAPQGTFSEHYFANAYFATLDENLRHYDDWGGPSTYPHYANGWAVVGNTPFRYYKQTAYEGGTRVPLILSWPSGIAARGETRGQYQHVTDITPTILDAAGIAPAAMVNGERQMAFDGVSMKYSFAAPAAPTRHPAQYYEMYGNRSIYANGWKAVVPHRLDVWDFMNRPVFSGDKWELYNLATDPGEQRNVAAANPRKLAQMKALFDREAKANNVYPLTNTSEAWGFVRKQLAADMARRNFLWTYHGATARIPEALAPPVPSTSFTIEAKLDLDAGAGGTVAAIGGRHGGFALHLRKGRPVFTYRSLDLKLTEIAADRALRQGPATILLRFERRSEREAVAHILADGVEIASGTIRGALPRLSFSPSETFDLGQDSGSGPLADGKTAGALDGRIRTVNIRITPPEAR